MTADRRDAPSRRDPALSGLEVWLTGTPTELDAALIALTAAGHATQTGRRHPLAGTDTGRHRQYVRLTVTTARRPSPLSPADAAQGGTLLDLDAARATRRPA